MKKIVSILSILVLSVGSIMAQTSYKQIKGYVIDKYGNPIPGAEVMTPGGGESVLTDADGSFNINVHMMLESLSATYDGMTTQTLKINPSRDLVFSLKREPKYSAFLNVMLGYTYNKYVDYKHSKSSGLMVGMLGKWGCYVKATDFGRDIDFVDSSFNITVGAIKSIYHRTLYIYAGAGYGKTFRWYDYYFYYDEDHEGYGYDDYDYKFCHSIAADFGFIYKTEHHFNLTIGYNLIPILPFTGIYNAHIGSGFVHGVQLGLGYVF